MSAVTPIRRREDVDGIMNFYLARADRRDWCLVSFGIYSALRVGDLLRMTWGDVYDFERERFKDHVLLTEQKTDKPKSVYIGGDLTNVLASYKTELESGGEILEFSTFLFRSRKGSNRPIGREQAYRIVKNASEGLGIDGSIGCHSLRKTFGYHAWKNGASPAVIMEIYNHSSFNVTRRYLGIEQDDKDEVYRNMNFNH